jgi:hypothetical protein
VPEKPLSKFLAQWGERPYSEYLVGLSRSVSETEPNDFSSCVQKIVETESKNWPNVFLEEEEYWHNVEVLLNHDAIDILESRIENGDNCCDIMDFILSAVWMAFVLEEREMGINSHENFYDAENEELAFSIFYCLSLLPCQDFNS